MSSRRVNALVILGLYIEEINKEIQRDIIVYSDSINRAKEVNQRKNTIFYSFLLFEFNTIQIFLIQISTVLENSELKAELIRTSLESDSGLVGYLQGNVALSREYKHFTIRYGQRRWKRQCLWSAENGLIFLLKFRTSLEIPNS